MSTRNYIIHASVFKNGAAEVHFNKADEEGTESRLTDPHRIMSRDGLTDALRGLIDAIEDGEVEFWNDDDEEDEFVDGMIARHDSEGLYVRRTLGAGQAAWTLVSDGMISVPDEQMATWVDDGVASIVFDPRVNV